MKFIVPVTIEVDTGDNSRLDPKTAHLLRRSLQETLEDAVDSTLTQYDINNQLVHSVLVDEEDES
mgnify:CR=1 FL=1